MTNKELLLHLIEELMDEEYDIDKATPENISFELGWNTAISRVAILINAQIRRLDDGQ